MLARSHRRFSGRKTRWKKPPLARGGNGSGDTFTERRWFLKRGEKKAGFRTFPSSKGGLYLSFLWGKRGRESLDLSAEKGEKKSIMVLFALAVKRLITIGKKKEDDGGEGRKDGKDSRSGLSFF